MKPPALLLKTNSGYVFVSVFSPSRVQPACFEKVCVQMLASLCAIFFFNFVFASSWLICLLRCAFAEPFSDTTLRNFLRKCARRLGVVWGLRCVSHTNLFGKCLFTCHAACSYALCSLAFFLPLAGPYGKYVKHGSYCECPSVTNVN